MAFRSGRIKQELHEKNPPPKPLLFICNSNPMAFELNGVKFLYDTHQVTAVMLRFPRLFLVIEGSKIL